MDATRRSATTWSARGRVQAGSTSNVSSIPILPCREHAISAWAHSDDGDVRLKISGKPTGAHTACTDCYERLRLQHTHDDGMFHFVSMRVGGIATVAGFGSLIVYVYEPADTFSR